MCGIGGYYSLSQQSCSVESNLLEHMQKKMEHRGPDGYRIFQSADRSLGLVHRRLSIMDLSEAGFQPFFDEEKKIILCCNGEIYNFKQIAQELAALGYQFHSHSDNEVLLYAYKAWGIAFLDKLEGMFAFVIYDDNTKELYLVRDRIGVKPLYFSLHGNYVSFASEIKALWAFPWISKKLNERALFHYLTYMISPAPMTMYEGVYKLPAGHYLKVDAHSNVTFQQWYDPLFYINKQKQEEFSDYTRCEQTVERLLLESIEKRMMADVQYGVFLSGGIDSSLNVALMAQLTDQVKTFTVAFSDEPERNETQWAEKIAKRFNTDHHVITISEKEAFEFFQDMMYHHDEPLADCVSIPLYYVSKLLKDAGVTVVQVGEGADELFCGYRTYIQYLKLYQNYWYGTQKYIPAFAKQGVFHAVASLFPNKLAYHQMVKNWADGKPLFWGGAVALPDRLKESWFTSEETTHVDSVVKQLMPDFNQHMTSAALPEYYMQQAKMLHPGADFLQTMLYLELKHRLPELLLMRVDKMTMATAVEARVPFLDHKLVECALQIPMKFKYRDGQTKYILKKIAEKYLPHESIYRKKVGFSAPTARWFTQGNYFKPYFDDLLQKKKTTWQQHFNFDAISQTYRDHTSKKGSYHVPLWALQNVLASDIL